jgi:hypothetical protein
MRRAFVLHGLHLQQVSSTFPDKRRGARRSARAGISLLEVVFSIGVVMIGLMGVALLLPIAGVQANKGAIADSAARRGRDAVSEFHVRGMADYTLWRGFDSTLGQFRALTPQEILTRQSYCIDPRFIARGASNAAHVRRGQFPYIVDVPGPVAGTTLNMARVTLAPSAVVAPWFFMGQLQADAVFTGSDDLVFDLPSDRTLGPQQNFSLIPVAPFPPLKRNTNGTVSWMATLVPKLNRWQVPTDEYTLSIVVFSRRVIDQDSGLANLNLSSERLLQVRNFWSGTPATGGGDVELVTLRDYPDDIELRSGNWVMLSSFRLVPGGGPSDFVPVHKWYRVGNVEEEALRVGGVWVRNATLAGPDWDWGNMADNFATGTYSTRTYVTHVRGVVAVFEKTIRLESSSLWMN